MRTTLRLALALVMAAMALAGAGRSDVQAAGAHIERVADKSLVGSAFARLRSLTYDQCVARCLADDRCVALEHYKGGGIIRRSSNCALFSSVRESKSSRFSDIGYKRTETANSTPTPTPAPGQPPAPGRPVILHRVPGPAVSPEILQKAEKQAEEASRRTAAQETGRQVDNARRKAFEASRSLQSKRVESAPAPPPSPVPQAAPAPSVSPPPPPPPVTSAPPRDTTASDQLPGSPKTRGLVRVPAAGGGAVRPAAPFDGVAPIPPQADWQVVPVFYGTDRNRKDTAKRIAYGNDRGRRLELGRALVTVPREHQVPNIERPWTLSIPYFGVVYEASEDPKHHFTIQEIRAVPKADLLAMVRQRLQSSQAYANQSLVFVHGYNVGFEDAIYRTAQISYDLQYDGAAFTYSWPSGNGWTSYPYDRDSSQQAEQYLYEFMQMVLNETGTEKVSIIAHSMGNQMLLQVLRSLKQRNPEVVTRINQIVLAAPDVDRDSFEFLASEIRGIASGITLYAAGNDVALEASRIFAGNRPRAGDVPPEGPVVVPGIDTIDITAVSTSYLALNHNGYAEHTELLSDIKALIQKSLRPPELRNSAYHPVTLPAGIYWRYGLATGSP